MKNIKAPQSLCRNELKFSFENNEPLIFEKEDKLSDATIIKTHNSHQLHIATEELIENHYNITHYQLTAQAPANLSIHNNHSLLALLITLQGKFTFTCDHDRICFLPFQANLFYHTGKKFKMHISGNTHEAILIIFKSGYLMQWQSENALCNFLQSVNKNENAVLVKGGNVPVSPALLKSIHLLLENKLYEPHNMYRTIRIINLIAQLLDLASSEEPKNPDLLKRFPIEKVIKAREHVLQNLDSNILIDDLCKTVQLDRGQLNFGFKYLFGTTINELVRAERMQKAQDLLQSSANYTLENIAREVGYKSQAKFMAAFQRYFGYKPANF